jgi:transposase
MAKHIVHKKLTPTQREELQRCLATTPHAKIYRRVRMLLYLDEGYSAEEIQAHTGYAERAQFYWLRRYRDEGLDGLADRPRSGRPRTRPQMKDRLGRWARLTLEQMHRHHPKAYLRCRAQMVLLWDTGYTVEGIANIVGCTVRTVGRVLAAYARDGLAGLYRKAGSGRRSRLRPEQWNQVKQWVRQGPQKLGYRFVKWTTRSLRKYLEKRFNITFSREWLRQRLHQFMQYSWTRGKKEYAYPQNEKRKKARKRFCRTMLKYLKQALNGEIMLVFEDESIFTLFGEVGYSWSPVGTTRLVPSAGKRGRVVVFGAVEPVSGRTHYHLETEASINEETTLRFVKQMVRYYQKHRPGVPLVIVLDKHPGHTAHLVTDFVEELEHVTLFNTPTQSPDLNPIERLWDWLSDRMIKDDFFETKADLKRAVRCFFCYIAGLKNQVLSWLGDLQTLYTEKARI